MMRFLWLGTLLFLILLLALVTGFKPLFWVLYIYAAASIISYALTWIQSWGLEVRTQEISVHPQVGRSAELQVVVRERTGLPRVGLRACFISDITDDVVELNLSPHSTKTWNITGTCKRRGWNNIGSLAIVASDITETFKAQWHRGQPQHIFVHPNTIDIPRAGIVSTIITGEIGEGSQLAGASQTAFMVREYVAGDPLNQIHWPSSARKNRLMTKQFEGAGTNEVRLFVDMEQAAHVRTGDDSSEEFCVTIAASIAKALIEEGHAVGLVSQGDEHNKAAPQKGEAQFWDISRVLALVRAESRTSFLRLLEEETADLTAGTAVVVVSTWPGRNISSILDFLSRRGILAVSLLVDVSSFGASLPRGENVFSGAERHRSTFLIKKDGDLPEFLRSVREHLATY